MLPIIAFTSNHLTRSQVHSNRCHDAFASSRECHVDLDYYRLLSIGN
jgi:hypothetical protein